MPYPPITLFEDLEPIGAFERTGETRCGFHGSYFRVPLEYDPIAATYIDPNNARELFLSNYPETIGSELFTSSNLSKPMLRHDYSFTPSWLGPLRLRVFFWHAVNPLLGSDKRIGVFLRTLPTSSPIKITACRGAFYQTNSSEVFQTACKCLEGVMDNYAIPDYSIGQEIAPGALGVKLFESAPFAGLAWGALLELDIAPAWPGVGPCSFSIASAIDLLDIRYRNGPMLDLSACGTPGGDSPLFRHPVGRWPNCRIALPGAGFDAKIGGESSHFLQYTLGQSLAVVYGGDVTKYSAALPFRYNRGLYGVDQHVSIRVKNPYGNQRIVKGYLVALADATSNFKAAIYRPTMAPSWAYTSMPYDLWKAVQVFQIAVPPGEIGTAEFRFHHIGGSTNPMGVMVHPAIKCLVESTVVPIWNGQAKEARHIELGDVLVGRSAAGEIKPQIVTRLFGGDQPCVRIAHSGGALLCSEGHRVLGDRNSWMEARLIHPGRHKLHCVGGGREVVSGVDSAGVANVYGWACEPDHTFLAGGVLHHNKHELAGGIE